MAGSRALPDLVARIRVDSSGVDQAIAHLIGSFSKADLAFAGVAAGIGLLVIGGKSMIDSAEKSEKAENDLVQAIDAHNAAIGKTSIAVADQTKLRATEAAANRAVAEEEQRLHDKRKVSANDLMHLQDLEVKAVAASKAVADANTETAASADQQAMSLDEASRYLQAFIEQNRRYISDQSEVIEGFAKLTRSGLTQTEVQKDMNRAIDLAALKHISLSDAVQILDQAEHGRLKGLSDLGITTAKYTDAQGEQIASSHDVAKAMQELDQKTQGGRATLTNLQQDTNALSNDWQDLAQKGGPVLLTAIDEVVKAATGIYDEFDRIGHDDALWGAISDRLVKMANWIHQWIIGPLGQVGEYISGAPITYGDSATGYTNAPGSSAFGKGGKASGGPVVPGGVYTVGENGPETLVMGGTGGMVIPNGGGMGGMVYLSHNQPIILDGAVIGRLIDRRIARSRIGSS